MKILTNSIIVLNSLICIHGTKKNALYTAQMLAPAHQKRMLTLQVVLDCDVWLMLSSTHSFISVSEPEPDRGSGQCQGSVSVSDGDSVKL